MSDARHFLDEGRRKEKSGLFEHALEYFRAAAQAAQALEDPCTQAEALIGSSTVHRAICAWDDALAEARCAASVAGRSGLFDVLAQALNAEAAVYLCQGELEHAGEVFERMLAIARDERIRGVALQNLAAVSAQRGDFMAARGHFLASSQCFERAGYEWGQACALNNSAAVAIDQHDWEQAELLGREAVSIALRIEDLELAGVARLNLSEAVAERGSLEEAELLVSEALGYFAVTGNGLRHVECIRLFGDIFCKRLDHEVARRLYENGKHMAEEIGAAQEAREIAECLAKLPPQAVSL